MSSYCSNKDKRTNSDYDYSKYINYLDQLSDDIGTTFFQILSNVKTEDKNVKEYLFYSDFGYKINVYNKNKFINDYNDTFWINKVCIVQ